MSRQEDLDGLFGSLRQAGYKITQPRRAVIETLAEAATHLTAPDVVEAVHRRAPGVGRASVYRTLDLLTRMGLAQSSTLGGNNATYLLTPSKRHHHIVCVECHTAVAFDEWEMRELEGQLGERLGFQVVGHLLELYGRCPDCLTETE